MRYFNKATKTEAIVDIHPIDDDCIILPDNHLFWMPIPSGKVLEYDLNGMPVLQDQPALTFEDLNADALIALTRIDQKTIRALREGDQVRIDDLEAQAIEIRANFIQP